MKILQDILSLEKKIMVESELNYSELEEVDGYRITVKDSEIYNRVKKLLLTNCNSEILMLKQRALDGRLPPDECNDEVGWWSYYKTAIINDYRKSLKTLEKMYQEDRIAAKIITRDIMKTLLPGL